MKLSKLFSGNLSAMFFSPTQVELPDINDLGSHHHGSLVDGRFHKGYGRKTVFAKVVQKSEKYLIMGAMRIRINSTKILTNVL